MLSYVSKKEFAIVSNFSAPASPLWRGGPPLLPFSAAPLPFLSCCLSYFKFHT